MPIQYTSDEQFTFQYFFTICDKTGQGILNQDMAINFFKASDLNQQILSTVYQIASSNGNTLTKDEFFAALKLIALAQQGYFPEEKLLTQNIPTPLPSIQGYQHPIYDIPVEQMRKYETYFLMLDKDGTQTIEGKQVKALFSKSGLSLDQLKELWNLCDIGEKGHLSKGEFIVGLHLIYLCSKCKYPLPINLPDSLLQMAARISINPRSRLESNQNVVPQQRFGSNSNLLNQPRKRLGSNANNGIQQVQHFQQVQQVIQPLNANILPGYDQNGMNSMRQQINDSTQQVYQMQNQFNYFYQNTTLQKQEEIQLLQAQNDNLKLMLSNLQEQYRVINEDLSRIRTLKQGLNQQNQKLQQQIGIQLEQNKDQFYQLQQESQQQQEQQYFQPPYQFQQLSLQSHNFGFQNNINYDDNNSPVPKTTQINLQPQWQINPFIVDQFQKQPGILKNSNGREAQKKKVTFAQHQDLLLL